MKMNYKKLHISSGDLHIDMSLNSALIAGVSAFALYRNYLMSPSSNEAAIKSPAIVLACAVGVFAGDILSVTIDYYKYMRSNKGL
jgi:hypothetical protein